MNKKQIRLLRRISLVFATGLLTVIWLIANPASYQPDPLQEPLANTPEITGVSPLETSTAKANLANLEVKGRAPKSDYNREAFYRTWPVVDGCNLRQRIIKRELGASAKLDGCDVIAGEFDEPYTGVHLVFTSKAEISHRLQIDHVVALSDAWQKGAQQLTPDTRYAFATDPLNLLAVDGPANMQKGDGDAATWLPKNKSFRCQYVIRQISVKAKYRLWVTVAEKTALEKILATCPH